MESYSISTELGIVTLNWTGRGLLKSIRWSASAEGPTSLRPRALHPYWRTWVDRFVAYFHSGEPLGEIPWDKVDAGGWTDFQREVYHAIEFIPHGETRTYSWVANRIGRPGACRAVGQALRKNPTMIMVPCHRVVSSEGGFGGFMGKHDPSDPEILLKRRLIDLETRYLNPVFPFLLDDPQKGNLESITA